jgi:uncharacterized repeat protein (TIGR02543 family)
MPAQIAGAATQLVTNCNDSGPGSLRQAVLDAASGDTVNFAPDLGCSTILLTSGDIEIATDLSIVGPGPSELAVSGNNASQVLVIDSGITATISGLTIEDGNASSGGGIYNKGTLTLTNSTLSSNTASNGWGAGLLAAVGSQTNVVDSTFSDNLASIDGGGIFNYGTLTVSASTFSGDKAINGDGGGIYNFYQETMSVRNSTLSDNSAGFNGGGIVNEGGSMTVTSSTLSGNSAGTSGSDIAAGSTTTVLRATILADGKMTTVCSGDITDGGYNLDDDSSCGFTATNHSISGSTTLDLGPLANNGGPTDTFLPAATSSAVGVIPTGTTLNGVQICPRVDQRGVASVGNCTIGAVEVAENTVDTVAFASDGGAAVSSLSGPDGSSITLPSDTYPGYTFDGWFTQASGGTKVGGAGSSYTIPSGGITLYAHWTPISRCTASLHAHVLNARYAKGTFTGLFCVNAKGFGTYAQGSLSGFGWVTVVKGTTVIAALGKNLFLAGSTNGTKSSFLELAPAPSKFGTFTLS